MAITGIIGGMTVIVRLTSTGHPWFGEAAVLLDDYRQHYGANPAPEAVSAWMGEQVLADRYRIYVGGDEIHAYGICAVAVVPATLTLRTAWLIRDLYVSPQERRHGLARGMIEQVAVDARAAGAHRLSLQTEAGNPRASHLYAVTGFTAVEEITLMDRLL